MWLALSNDQMCDFIVALGGGSVIDASKAIGLMATNEGDDLWKYVQFGTGGKVWPPVPSLPIVAVPTTAGTGSETDAGAVITNPETDEKTGVFGFGTMLVVAVIDPELMVSVPAWFKAYQGFDALFHSMEGFISKQRNEMSRMVAGEAIRNVSGNLAQAIAELGNVEAMGKVAFGSYLSGIQMCVGSCTSAHPLEHALSVYHHDLPHGVGLIMISKAFYSFFIEKRVCDDRFIEMAQLMGRKDADKPEEFPKMVQNARDTLGVNFLNDPYQLSDEDCLKIYSESYR